MRFDLSTPYTAPSPAEKLAPQMSHVSSPGRQLLITGFGPLDLLGTIAVALGNRLGLPVPVFGLERLIAIKQETAREKTRLLRIVEERNRAEIIYSDCLKAIKREELMAQLPGVAVAG